MAVNRCVLGMGGQHQSKALLPWFPACSADSDNESAALSTLGGRFAHSEADYQANEGSSLEDG
jgi:hypothetical protein